MYDSVLIATDGSDGATGGVEYGLSVAEALDAKVHVLYVVETSATYILTVELSDDDRSAYKEYGEEILTEVVERAAARDLEADGVVRTGKPAEEIVEHAERNEIDTIVMGRQGHGAIDRYVGSTTEKVIRMAETPVTVVTPE